MEHSRAGRMPIHMFHGTLASENSIPRHAVAHRHRHSSQTFAPRNISRISSWKIFRGYSSRVGHGLDQSMDWFGLGGMTVTPFYD